MANLIETDNWPEAVYQIEEDDPVLGGPTGVTNYQPTQLAARSRFQRLRNVTPWDGILSYPAALAYVSHAGSTWRSVGPSLNVEPGTDPAKWTRWGHTTDELAAAFLDLERTATSAVATGTANAIAVAYAPEVTELVDGMVLWFRGISANTGAATLKVNALATKPLLGAAHAPLQGGEVVPGGRCMVVWSSALDSFVLFDGTGGGRQVGNPSKAQHAVVLAQFVATLSDTTAVFRIPNASSPTRPIIVQTGFMICAAGVTSSAVFPMAFPNRCVSVVLCAINGTANMQAYATLKSKSLTGFSWDAFWAPGGNAPVMATIAGSVNGYFIAVGE